MATPDGVRSWLRVLFRDCVSPALGVFLLLNEFLLEEPVRPWGVIAGMTLLGYPVVDRIDTWLQKNSNGRGTDS